MAAKLKKLAVTRRQVNLPKEVKLSSAEGSGVVHPRRPRPTKYGSTGKQTKRSDDRLTRTDAGRPPATRASPGSLQ